MDTIERFSIRQIDNAFIVDYATTDEEGIEYTNYEFAYFTLDNVIEKIQEVFKQNGR
jgi:hypothetical protein